MWIPALVVVLLVIGVTAFAGAAAPTIRWDIVSIDFEEGTVNPGGIASALAADGSKITLTGTGTFVPGAFDRVSGGGTWSALDADGNEIGSGTYQVRRLLQWKVAPGDPPPLEDQVEPASDGSAGLVHLKILYSDGSAGTLTVSCHLVGTPDTVFEGIAASKGFVDYTFSEAPPAPPGDENRTLFHIR